MSDDYKNIKVPPEVFERLKRGKDDGQSWGHYLKEQREKAEKFDEMQGGMR